MKSADKLDSFAKCITRTASVLNCQISPPALIHRGHREPKKRKIIGPLFAPHWFDTGAMVVRSLPVPPQTSRFFSIIKNQTAGMARANRKKTLAYLAGDF